MSNSKKICIGLFGFGVVGEGIYKVLQQTPSLQATIKRICIRQEGKERKAPADLFTTFYNDIINDKEIDVVIELIDDANEAYKIVTAALRLGKAVVSANKKMIASHLPELLQLQKEFNVSFLYEGAVCGSIPIIRNLEEYYDNDLLQSIQGIVNGSTNYILSKVNTEGVRYEEALLQAQQLGFAGSNPQLDVSGQDAINKLVILLAHAYGIVVPPANILCKGIEQIQLQDVIYAKEKGLQIKLVAQAIKLNQHQICAWVLPQFIDSNNQLHHVKDEYNGVVLESRLADKQFLYGKGAGRFPTSSAVLSDLSALRYRYRYEYKKLQSGTELSLANDYYLRVYVSFNSWAEVNKWDFYSIEELYSTEGRQHLLGTIHIQKLKECDWFYNPQVSLILCTEGLIRKEDIIGKSLKKISLQLAGVH